MIKSSPNREEERCFVTQLPVLAAVNPYVYVFSRDIMYSAGWFQHKSSLILMNGIEVQFHRSHYTGYILYETLLAPPEF